MLREQFLGSTMVKPQTLSREVETMEMKNKDRIHAVEDTHKMKDETKEENEEPEEEEEEEEEEQQQQQEKIADEDMKNEGANLETEQSGNNATVVSIEEPTIEAELNIDVVGSDESSEEVAKDSKPIEVEFNVTSAENIQNVMEFMSPKEEEEEEEEEGSNLDDFKILKINNKPMNEMKDAPIMF